MLIGSGTRGRWRYVVVSLIVKFVRTVLGQIRGRPTPMPNGPMSKGASPTNEPMANGLELPEASNAAVVAIVGVVVDEEAPRRKTPNNHGVIIVVDDNAFTTSCVRPRTIAIQALPTPGMVQQHHYCCL